MKQLIQEVDANYSKFDARWKSELDAAYNSLKAEDGRYQLSYRRLVSLQAWRTSLLHQIMSEEALAFFLEAQNDALTSHVLARVGLWRSALQTLRSCVENAMACIYYADHHIELELWLAHAHRLGFGDLSAYLKEHPRVRTNDFAKTQVNRLQDEYATLSRAVHGSAKRFRMTVDGSETTLWSTDVNQVGPWLDREQHVVESLNLLLLAIYGGLLEGNQQLNLRKAISLAIPPAQHATVQQHLGVALLTA